MFKKIQERIFPFLIALSALSVSASAAFYSISGLSKLFAGAAFAVIIMAASLEVAKLVIASLLYQYRKTLPFLLKAYLSIACIVLILITSMGIYGFLSAAYQDTANKEGNIEARIVLIETKRDNVKEQLEVYTEEKTSINEAVAELRKGLSNNKVQWKDKETGQIITSTSSSTRKTLTKQLDQAIERQTEVNAKVDELNEKIFNFETEIVETRIEEGSTSELGPLKYLSGLTGLSMDKIINYLLLVIIFVFDPLAIALVIAANFAFARLRKPTKENLYGEVVEIDKSKDIEVECSVPEGKEFNTPYDIDDLVPDTPYTKEEVSEVIKNEVEQIKEKPIPPPSKNQSQIKDLEKQIAKINSQDTVGKKSSIAISNLQAQIKKLRDEDNTITY
jgi:predicted  nucleic acid-binding Zn-ribbon protein